MSTLLALQGSTNYGNLSQTLVSLSLTCTGQVQIKAESEFVLNALTLSAQGTITTTTPPSRGGAGGHWIRIEKKKEMQDDEILLLI